MKFDVHLLNFDCNKSDATNHQYFSWPGVDVGRGSQTLRHAWARAWDDTGQRRWGVSDGVGPQDEHLYCQCTVGAFGWRKTGAQWWETHDNCQGKGSISYISFTDTYFHKIIKTCFYVEIFC